MLPFLTHVVLQPSNVLRSFRDEKDEPDPVRCAQLLVRGRARAVEDLVEAAGCSVEVAGDTVAEILSWEQSLTGAEAISVLLADADVKYVFVYAGTSELALCDAVERMPGVHLVNGRGDKESAFLAAGASLLRPNRGAAILHGARGLTNAAGGVADARRNEAGTVFLVGLPSSSSERFLPPHGEADLFGGMASFADWAWQAPAVPNNPARRRQASQRFVTHLRDALVATAEPPCRPALFGVPQDVAEQRWIPVNEIARPSAERSATNFEQPAMDVALRALRASRRPVFLVDDYALRYAGLRESLDAISQAVGGAVLQLRYRRGPMLFERLRQDEVCNFAGWLNQFSAVHNELLASADLLVTVEDRNVYERVVGSLPECPKIAVNTDPEKVLKNEYLGEEDALIVGNPPEVLAELHARLATTEPAPPWFSSTDMIDGAAVTPEPPSAEVEHGRQSIARALAGVLAGWERPVLVDDSQMFGGLLSESYDDFPRGLRVFGGHGGFVGCGLPYATGLAIAEADVRVMCTLGDQAFTNSFQALVAAIQTQARILFVVCNNGESVSLKKQAAASFGPAERAYLANVEGLNYHELVASLGIPSFCVPVPVGGPTQVVDDALLTLQMTLEKAAAVEGPSMVELVVPSDPEVWRGIWLTQGFEQQAAVTV